MSESSNISFQLNHFKWIGGDHVSFIEYSPRWQLDVPQLFIGCSKGHNCSKTRHKNIGCEDGQNNSSNIKCSIVYDDSYLTAGLQNKASSQNQCGAVIIHQVIIRSFDWF